MSDTSDISAFDVLIGTWHTEATHPTLPGVVVHGTTSFAWLEGEAFVIQRSHNDHEQFPDAIAVIGPPEDGGDLLMEYFDSRGVRRTYDIGLEDGVLQVSRDHPSFDQRYSATLADAEFTGLWQVAETPGAWTDDLAVAYRRVLETP